MHGEQVDCACGQHFKAPRRFGLAFIWRHWTFIIILAVILFFAWRFHSNTVALDHLQLMNLDQPCK
jgi:hypothetical protein